MTLRHPAQPEAASAQRWGGTLEVANAGGASVNVRAARTHDI